MNTENKPTAEELPIDEATYNEYVATYLDNKFITERDLENPERIAEIKTLLSIRTNKHLKSSKALMEALIDSWGKINHILKERGVQF